MSRIVFVGEAPGPSGKVGFDGWSGRRLALITGMPPESLNTSFSFLNVFKKWPGPQAYKHHEDGGKGSAFPIEKARRQMPRLAREINAELPPKGGLVILLGKRVAQAFRFDESFFRVGMIRMNVALSRTRSVERAVKAAVVPHPSGVNRWWNAADNVIRFRDFFEVVLSS